MKSPITLSTVRPDEIPVFCKKLQQSFAVAVIEAFGPQKEPIPSDHEILESFDLPDAQAYHILWQGNKVGGVMVKIHEDTQHNHLVWFFISPEHHSKGLGSAAWKAVEERYPNTKVWDTVTPYFEKRNIHFYVNKCGFHIVEFYNMRHKDPNMEPPGSAQDGDCIGSDEFFRFVKRMHQD